MNITVLFNEPTPGAAADETDVLVQLEAVDAALRALGHSVGAPAPPSMLNGPISSSRHLAFLQRPLDDLKQIASRDSGVKINDVVIDGFDDGIERR